MKANILTAGKIACLLLLLCSGSISAQTLVVSDDIIHTKHGESNGSITLSIVSGQSPFTYVWSTGDTINAITGLEKGTYSVTVTSANDTVVNTYDVAYYVSWDKFINTYENSNHEVICTSDFIEDNILSNFTVSQNRLKADTSGTVTFYFERGDDFSGVIGMVGSRTYSEDLPGIGFLILTENFYDMEQGLYLTGEEMEYLGDVVDSVSLEIKYVFFGDSVSVLKNGVECVRMENPYDFTLYPGVVPMFEDGKLTYAICDFATILRIAPPRDTDIDLWQR